jgi:hypothetical protein
MELMDDPILNEDMQPSVKPQEHPDIEVKGKVGIVLGKLLVGLIMLGTFLLLKNSQIVELE